MSASGPFPMPHELASCDHGPEFRKWRASLPAIVAEMAPRWLLHVGEPFQPGGQTAWVAPAIQPSGPDLVLKVGWRHPEGEAEAAGLRRWDGNGTVRLNASDTLADTFVLLLERCTPGTALSDRPEPEQDEVIAGLLPRLWPTPHHDEIPTLHSMCQHWADESEQKLDRDRRRLDPGLIRTGLDLFRSLPATTDRHGLLCTDLHAGNVLAAQREPWLVIDPKPHVGDPTYDALQHMLNCPTRLRADPHGLARRMADLLGLDAERLVLWLFARCIQEAPHWRALTDVARRIAPA